MTIDVIRVGNEADVGAPDNGIIHARTADLLAEFLAGEDVELSHRQPGEQGFRLLQQPHVGLRERLGLDALDGDDLVGCVLDDGDAERQRTVGDGNGRHLRQDFAEAMGAHAMDVARAFLLAEADADHLGETAFDGPVETGVRLDPGDDHDRIGGMRVRIEIAWNAFRGATAFDDIHRRSHRRSGSLLVDAQACENRSLPLGCAAAVTAHGRHDEGLQSLFAKPCHDSSREPVDMGDATTADSDRDARTGRKVSQSFRMSKRGTDTVFDIRYGRCRRLLQADPRHLGQFDGLQRRNTDHGKLRCEHDDVLPDEIILSRKSGQSMVGFACKHKEFRAVGRRGDRQATPFSFDMPGSMRARYSPV
ncbi:MAG: hypothetical protein R3C97_14140 [Geminicoccaceae bacterium]